ncbi:MAG TPA: response regulator [Armatimonadota bacterium]|nr:response regulator [Armatimonadota bacterium]
MPVRVLLLESDDRERAAMLGALEQAGFVVRTATDPESAMAGIRERWPDVALLGLNGPGCDAMDLLWQVATAKRPVPVVITKGPPGWSPRLTAWLSRGFVEDTPRGCRLVRAVVAAISGLSGAYLPPVA